MLLDCCNNMNSFSHDRPRNPPQDEGTLFKFTNTHEKVRLGSFTDTGKRKSKMSKHVTHGYHLVKGKSSHPMKDYVVVEFKQVEEHELGLFAIFDGHLSHDIPDYLRSHLFVNILNERMHRRAYHTTDTSILDKSRELGKGVQAAILTILIDCQKLVVANVGDSRAVACKDGVAKQLSVDHEPSKERTYIEDRGGFVSNFPTFGDKSLKKHLFVILASDGIWKVMTNQEAVECIRNIKDAKAAAKHLTCS
ncbi:putative protein phosphatase 2C 39 [Camellia lanceoleosa]|uniref:Uncharacterized protein n=1 Tax=Camellia lanceoleosa TaxID=1840588 RepID=A0ACC0G8R6_9ERIC|nr:putative protein phosphatase 2C 39 [Camellia lanceoleosa]